MKKNFEESSFAFTTFKKYIDYIQLSLYENEICIASKIKFENDLKV